jgi:hypothetical protein
VLLIFSKYCQSGKNFTIKAKEKSIKITNKNQILFDGSKNKLSTILSKFSSPKVKKIAKKQIRIRIEDTELKQKFLKEIFNNLLLYEIVAIAKKAKVCISINKYKLKRLFDVKIPTKLNKFSKKTE